MASSADTAMVAERKIRPPKAPKLPTQDPIRRMLEQRAANLPKTERIVVKIHVPNERSGVTSTTGSTEGLRRTEVEEIEWQEWMASQARWMEARRTNASMKRWRKKGPASTKLPKWVKQRPSS
jgi:hypothetical protein